MASHNNYLPQSLFFDTCLFFKMKHKGATMTIIFSCFFCHLIIVTDMILLMNNVGLWFILPVVMAFVD